MKKSFMFFLIIIVALNLIISYGLENQNMEVVDDVQNQENNEDHGGVRS